MAVLNYIQTDVLTGTLNPPVLLLDGEGISVLDNSLSPKPILVNNNVELTPDPKIEGLGSLDFTFNNNCFLTFSDHGDFDLTSGDFSIELWVNPTVLSNNLYNLISKQDGNNDGWSLKLRHAPNPSLILTVKVGLTTYTLENNLLDPILINRWTHIGLSRSGANWFLFIDGRRVEDSISLPIPSNTDEIKIGGGGFIGFIDNFTISKGVALIHTKLPIPGVIVGGFDSAIHLLLNADENSLEDKSIYKNGIFNTGDINTSSSIKKFGTHSIAVGGVTSYMSITDSEVFDLDVFYFTLDFWIYLTAYTNNIIYSYQTTNLTLTLDIAGLISLDANFGSGIEAIATTSTVPLGVWTHIAVIRDNDIVSLYKDGALENYISNINLIINSGSPYNTPIEIGRFNGYLDDFKFTYSSVWSSSEVGALTTAEGSTTGGLLVLETGDVPAGFNIITDISQGLHNLSPSGNVVSNDTVFKYGTASISFDGNISTYIRPLPNNFFFGLDDFTIDCWFYLNVPNKTHTLISTTGGNNPGYILSINTSNNMELYLESSDGLNPLGTAIVTGTTNLVTNIWYHAALVRSSTNVFIMLDGQIDYQGVISINKDFPVIDNTLIGASSFTGGVIIDDSTSAQTLNPTGQIELSITQKKYGLSSIDFNGGFASILAASQFNFGTQSFTLDAWVYLRSNKNHTLISTINTNSDGYRLSIDGNLLSFYVQQGVNTPLSTGLSSVDIISLNTWTHVAVTRKETNVYLFINGAIQPSATILISDEFNAPIDISFGKEIGDELTILDGYVDELRITPLAIWTSTFTPSTKQGLSFIPGPVLLLHGDSIANSANAITDQSLTAHTITPFNNAEITSTESVVGSGSMDLTGIKYISIAAHNDFRFGTAPFTVEFRLKTSISSSIARHNISLNGGWEIRAPNNTQIAWVYYDLSNTAQNETVTAVNYRDDNWHHHAFVRDSLGYLKYYFDGKVEATSLLNNIDYLISTDLIIGDGMSAYIDEFAIYAGFAKYKTDFTPSNILIRPENIDNILLIHGDIDVVSINEIKDSSFSNHIIQAFGAYADINDKVFESGSVNLTESRNMKISLSSDFVFSSSDWTVDFWAKFPTFAPTVVSSTLNLGNVTGFLGQSDLVIQFGTANLTIGMYIIVASGFFTGNIVSIDSPTQVTVDSISGNDFTFNGIASIIGDDILINYNYTNSGGWGVQLANDGLKLYSAINQPHTLKIDDTSGLSLDQWDHYAYVKSGTLVTFYKNGFSLGTTTTFNNVITFEDFIIGNVDSKIDDFRITRSALWTTNFTPPVLSPKASQGQIDLLLHFDDAAAETTDSSTFNHIISLENSAVLTNAQSKFGGRSLFINGSNQSASTLPNSNLNLGLEDFSFDLWVYPTVVESNKILISNRDNVLDADNVWALGIGTANVVNFTTISTTILEAITPLLLNEWNYIAISRNQGVTNLFINGFFQQSTNTVFDFSLDNSIKVGADGNLLTLASPLNMYFDEVRILKRLDRWEYVAPTPSLPIPNTPITLFLEANEFPFIDSSTNNHTLNTIGANVVLEAQSMRFDSTGRLQVIDPDFSYGTNDFTLECFFKIDTQVHQYIVGSDVDNQYLLGISNLQPTKLGLYLIGIAWPTDGTITVTPNVWHHVAISRNGDTIRTFLDGALDMTINVGAGYVWPSSAVTVGGMHINNFVGNIDDVRVLNSEGLYTVPFTTPNRVVNIEPSFLLQSNTFDGDTTFINSLGTHTIIPNNVAQHSTAQSKFGLSSISLPSNLTYLTVTPVDNAFAILTSDFTIDFWINVTTIQPWTTAFSFNNPLSLQLIIRNGSLDVLINNTSRAEVAVGFTINTWNHIAITRVGGNITIWFNGAFVKVKAIPGGVLNASTEFSIGRPLNGWVSGIVGFIEEFRLTLGQALWTSNFSSNLPESYAVGSAVTDIEVPLLPGVDIEIIANDIPPVLLIKGLTRTDSGGVLDSSPSNHAIENFGSVFLDDITFIVGPSSLNFLTLNSYLNVNDNVNDYFFNNADFTIEGYIKISTLPTSNKVIIMSQWINNVDAWQLYIDFATNGVTFEYANASSINTIAQGNTTGLSLNIWHHIAVTRESNTFRIFLNGTLLNNAAYTDTIPNINTPLRINGSVLNPNDSFIGHIDEINIVKGTAYYKAAFVPTTELLNSQEGQPGVLIHADVSATIIESSQYIHPLIEFGGVATSSFNPKVDIGSIYFDGVDDYLQVIYNSAFNLSNNDFTLTSWINFEVMPVNTQVTLLSQWTDSINSWQLYFDARNSTATNLRGVRFVINDTNVAVLNLEAGDASTRTAGVWFHVAVIREANTFSLYINGMALDQVIANITIPTITSNIRLSGQDSNGLQLFQGYMDEITLYTNIALYTDNFSPDEGLGIPDDIEPILLLHAEIPPNINTTLDGYIDSFRIIEGVARWTGPFDPEGLSQSNITFEIPDTITEIDSRLDNLTSDRMPGLPKPQERPETEENNIVEMGDTQVKLMCSFDGDFIDSSIDPHTLVPFGGATTSAAQSKFGIQSAVFNGTSSYFEVANSEDFNFSNLDFTIDFQCYLNTNLSHQPIISYGDIILNGYRFSIKQGGFVELVFVQKSLTTTSLTGSIILPINAWNHVAIIKKDNKIRTFVNGLDDITFDIFKPIVETTNNLIIGADIINGSYTNGYINELRIIKGYADWI